jgi:dedicator of cytokinesis protein 3
MQTSLAYLNVSNDVTSKTPSLGPSVEYARSGPLPTPAHSAFPEYPRARSRNLGSLGPSQQSKSTAAKFYHIFLDLRAFVASPCSPGETAEIFFSLYNKNESRFVTEEFCAILNQNGVLARDPSAPIRTLFTDLAQSDVQDPIFLVARIVRNGALKIGTNMSSIVANDNNRRGSEILVRPEPSTSYSSTMGWSESQSPTSPVSGRGSMPLDAPAFFRRPFGCAVLELTELSKIAAEQGEVSSTREYTMPIFTPVNEQLFSMLHQDILASNSKEYEKSPRCVSLVFWIIRELISLPGPRC